MHPTRLLPEYDSGDHVHPNDIGYVSWPMRSTWVCFATVTTIDRVSGGTLGLRR